MRQLLIILFLCTLFLNACKEYDTHILVFTKTEGFRHDCIPVAKKCLKNICGTNEWKFVSSEDAGIFNKEQLQKFDVVVFLNTTGDILNEAQQSAFEKYIRNHGAFLGIHAAADTEHDWFWYGNLVGTYFKSHPEIQKAEIVVKDSSHVCCNHFPKDWQPIDEWYNFKSQPHSNCQIVLELNEASYTGGEMNGNHPITWWQNYDGGRAFYTGLGHTKEIYKDPIFIQHLDSALKWLMYKHKI